MRSRVAAVIGLCLVLVLCCLWSPRVKGVSSDIVISQIYGGGGNSGATLKNDFIELFNRGTTTVSVTGWSVQYASTTGTSWQRTNVSGSIPPGGYLLVQEAQGAGGSVSLPAPDATGTIPMSATAGKVALVNNQTTITSGTSCPSGSSIVDFVGYGSGTNCFEGTGPTATLSNPTAALRLSNGCVDTDVNSADFSTGAPNPRNSASPLFVCGSPGGDLVVSQLYGGGGNSGATLSNDYIEILNRGTTSVSVNGWSVQYASSTGSSWQVTALTGVVAPGKYYLVQESSGGPGIALPTPDATGSTNLAASAGKVLLVTNSTPLSGTCPTGSQIIDFVGYGSGTNCFEGSGPTGAPSNTTADLRKNFGCTDTNDNAADFTVGTPNPRNSASPMKDCNAPPPPTPIHDIQGSGSTSPLVNTSVTTTGIVTGLKSNGFFLQARDTDVDSDANTSEGIFVFTSSVL
ncbi:MAG TPA: lamin tail domain-containing protein, partial [Candidatus Acidoferrales bacterium]|nr:lamin tail domain-containing protein [Candidatus Acidoferrales bacterium]